MIVETRVQARFLMRMAISLGFGILFAIGITLLLIPALYLVVEDIHDLFGVRSHIPPTTAAGETALTQRRYGADGVNHEGHEGHEEQGSCSSVVVMPASESPIASRHALT
jgi:hypothetical protein